MRQLRISLIFFLLTMFVLTSTLIPTVEAKMIDTDTYVSVQQYQDGKMQISELSAETMFARNWLSLESIPWRLSSE